MDTPERPNPRDVAEHIPVAPLDSRLGVEIVFATVERVVGRMPVEGNTQPFGLLHGGASAAFAETLGSVAASLHGYPDAVPVGTDLNITHHRGVRSGVVNGVASPIRLGRTMTSHEIVITDEQDRRVATARITCLMRSVERSADSPTDGATNS